MEENDKKDNPNEYKAQNLNSTQHFLILNPSAIINEFL